MSNNNVVLQKTILNMLVNTTLHTFRNNTQQENLSVINNLKQTYNGRQNTIQKIEQRELHKKHGRTVAFRKSISSSCYLVVPVVLLLLQTKKHKFLQHCAKTLLWFFSRCWFYNGEVYLHSHVDRYIQYCKENIFNLLN
jgi:hypothetical protein